MPTPILVLLCIVAMLVVIGGFITQWIRMANEHERRRSLGKRSDRDLVRENEALHGRVEQLYDRIETLERIVTDKPSRLAEEIDKLEALPPRPAPLPRKDEK